MWVILFTGSFLALHFSNPLPSWCATSTHPCFVTFVHVPCGIFPATGNVPHCLHGGVSSEQWNSPRSEYSSSHCYSFDYTTDFVLFKSSSLKISGIQARLKVLSQGLEQRKVKPRGIVRLSCWASTSRSRKFSFTCPDKEVNFLSLRKML